MFGRTKAILVSKGPSQFPNCWFHDPEEVMMSFYLASARKSIEIDFRMTTVKRRRLPMTLKSRKRQWRSR